METKNACAYDRGLRRRRTESRELAADEVPAGGQDRHAGVRRRVELRRDLVRALAHARVGHLGPAHDSHLNKRGEQGPNQNTRKYSAAEKYQTLG